jgi:murein DD-endopeptidase MepM/ murein hydrolase activator NlpD
VAGAEPLNRRAALAGLASLGFASRAQAAPPDLALSGRFEQGGYAIGRTSPGAHVHLNGALVTHASPEGFFILGFDRDNLDEVQIRVANDEGEALHTAKIKRGEFDIQRISGLASRTVTPDPAMDARIEAEYLRKQAGFASKWNGDGFKDGFTLPLSNFRVSARYGGQRILNGEPRQPHYGIDLAAPTGTPVLAPADGVVSMAESDLLYEGRLILLDHGQGLITAYLHLSEVAVIRGQAVKQGEQIGRVGSEGRATGPHLCWRMKWRGRNMNPMLLVGAKRPA